MSITALSVFDSEITPRDITLFLSLPLQPWYLETQQLQVTRVGEALDPSHCPLAFFLKCSVSCGRGSQARYVSCRDAQDRVADESNCAYSPRPAAVSLCFTPCGEWQAGDWSPVSMPTSKQALKV